MLYTQFCCNAMGTRKLDYVFAGIHELRAIRRLISELAYQVLFFTCIMKSALVQANK